MKDRGGLHGQGTPLPQDDCKIGRRESKLYTHTLSFICLMQDGARGDGGRC